ncbi:LLM class flavin-dependent oxidoreductase [Kitasatospora sp. NPDC088346]|uniref:LLM class flavin-dependent oxidoreductase n=1 Tax=Kitasatospora sp. NPDC088346 TaxID=3364073 RepID=UPI00382AB0E5
MPVEFIGMISTQDVSETRPATGPVVDRDYTRRFAQAHEEAGFDRILVAHSSASPDPLQVAAYAAAHTERLGLLIAHRPGFIAPTLAARTLATLDQFSGGRVAVHIITGGHDAEQRRDGDYLGKDERYARSDDYLTVLAKAWTADAPFDHDGPYYRFADFRSEVRPVGRIPVFFGGSSEAAYRVGGKHADTFALWGEPLAETAQQIASVRAAAAAVGRVEQPGTSVSFRPILGRTEDEAWERAHGILDTIRARADAFGGRRAILPTGPGAAPQNVGSQRLLAAAAKADRHDRALWTAPAAATGAAGNSTALVGTPETVAQALLDYVDLGVTTLLIRGYDPLDDALDYGREVLPLVRQEVARRDAARLAADRAAEAAGASRAAEDASRAADAVGAGR